MLWPPGFHGIGNFNLIPFLKALLKSLLTFEAGRECGSLRIEAKCCVMFPLSVGYPFMYFLKFLTDEIF